MNKFKLIMMMVIIATSTIAYTSSEQFSSEKSDKQFVEFLKRQNAEQNMLNNIADEINHLEKVQQWYPSTEIEHSIQLRKDKSRVAMSMITNVRKHSQATNKTLLSLASEFDDITDKIGSLAPEVERQTNKFNKSWCISS